MTNGFITNLLPQEDCYASNIFAAMTFVSAGPFWVEDDFAKTQLPRISVGDAATVVLMSFSDVAVTSRAAELGRGISAADAQPGVQGLSTVDSAFTRIRLAQRVPVRIEFDDVPCPVIPTAGLTATVSMLGHPALPAAPRRRPARKLGDEAPVPRHRNAVVGTGKRRRCPGIGGSPRGASPAPEGGGEPQVRSFTLRFGGWR